MEASSNKMQRKLNDEEEKRSRVARSRFSVEAKAEKVTI